MATPVLDAIAARLAPGAPVDSSRVAAAKHAAALLTMPTCPVTPAAEALMQRMIAVLGDSSVRVWERALKVCLGFVAILCIKVLQSIDLQRLASQALYPYGCGWNPA